MDRESLISNLKDRILNVRSEQSYWCFDLTNSSSDEASNLRRILLTQIPTYTIDIAIFNDNDSCLEDTEIAHRLGLCVLSQDLLPENKKEAIKFDFQGPCNVYIGDIIRTVNNTVNLVTLRDGEKLNGLLYLQEGTGDIHAKFSPVYRIAAIEQENSTWLFRCGITGAYTIETIIDIGVSLLADDMMKKIPVKRKVTKRR